MGTGQSQVVGIFMDLSGQSEQAYIPLYLVETTRDGKITFTGTDGGTVDSPRFTLDDIQAALSRLLGGPFA